jgi:hypothetical protein
MSPSTENFYTSLVSIILIVLLVADLAWTWFRYYVYHNENFRVCFKCGQTQELIRSTGTGVETKYWQSFGEICDAYCTCHSDFEVKEDSKENKD